MGWVYIDIAQPGEVKAEAGPDERRKDLAGKA